MIAVEKQNPKKSSTKAARIRGLGKYIVAPENERSIEKCVYQNALGFLSDTPEAQRAEMIALASECVRSRDPIMHYVLSWQRDEKPNPQQVDEAVAIFLNEMQLEGHQVIYGLHDDTQNRHVHIMVNRVHPDTLRAIDAGDGWKVKAGLRACARIEHAQGWMPEPGALYQVEEYTTERGEITQRVIEKRKAEQSQEPRGITRDREIHQAEQSAERIAITDAAPIIKAAKSWQELHRALAAAGMSYERKGSGAIIFVGDVPTKASSVDRAAALGAMQKRLGPYEPPQEKPNEYFSHQAKPHPRHLGAGTGNRMRNLSECRVATIENDKKDAGVLLIDARTSGRTSERVRWDTDRRRVGSSSKRISRPLESNQPAWSEYIEIRDARKAQKQQESAALKLKQHNEWQSLTSTLKAERDAALAGDWRGKGDARNLIVSAFALEQATKKLALREQQAAERKALRDRFPALPPYREWKLAPAIVGKIVIADENKASKLSATSMLLHQLERERDQHGRAIYRARGVDIFRDDGRQVSVLKPNSDEAIAASLLYARERFGRTLALTGDQSFQRRVVAVAVAQNISVEFADPALEALRLELTKAKQVRQDVSRQQSRQRTTAHSDEQKKTRQPTAPAPEKPVSVQAPAPAMPEPEKALGEKKLENKPAAPAPDKISLWLAAHPERKLVSPAPSHAAGRVLETTADGRYLLNINRAGAVAVYAVPAGSVPPLVGQVVEIAKHSIVQAKPGQEKGG